MIVDLDTAAHLLRITMLPYTIRDYHADDESSWLRCRVLSFLTTAYFDDVLPRKPTVPAPGFCLVTTDQRNTVIGILDITVEADLATIDTIAVHPDHQHQGIGRALLNHARTRLRALNVAILEAWTRDDQDTLRWYHATGFTESEHYLHVYANYYTNPDEPDRAIAQRRPGLRPISAFLHAALTDEQTLRDQFTRVHICRRLTRQP